MASAIDMLKGENTRLSMEPARTASYKSHAKWRLSAESVARSPGCSVGDVTRILSDFTSVPPGAPEPGVEHARPCADVASSERKRKGVGRVDAVMPVDTSKEGRSE